MCAGRHVTGRELFVEVYRPLVRIFLAYLTRVRAKPPLFFSFNPSISRLSVPIESTIGHRISDFGIGNQPSPLFGKSVLVHTLYITSDFVYRSALGQSGSNGLTQHIAGAVVDPHLGVARGYQIAIGVIAHAHQLGGTIGSPVGGALVDLVHNILVAHAYLRQG